MCGVWGGGGGDDDSKNMFTLQTKDIQTFSCVNKRMSCREIFIHSNTQRTNSGFFIYTESDMIH